MSAEDPFAEWHDTGVTIREYLGSGPYGDAYAAAVPYPCIVDHTTRLVRDAQAREVVSSATLYATGPDATVPPTGSLVRLKPDEREHEVIGTAEHDVDGLELRTVEVMLS
jgi:hypothetical protein